MVVIALIRHAVAALMETADSDISMIKLTAKIPLGEIHMKNQISKLLTVLVVVLACSSSAYAGCNNAEFTGTWDVTFSDGNSCRLLMNHQGEVDANESSCHDPFRGSTAPDSGIATVADDCSVNIDLVVEGATIKLAGQISRGRDVGAGRYEVPAYWVKGAFTMIRVP